MELLNYTNALSAALRSNFITQTEANKLFADFLNLQTNLKVSEDNTEAIKQIKALFSLPTPDVEPETVETPKQ